VTAEGFGKPMPVVDDSSPTIGQENRRVKIVLLGEVLGA
jgi:flagellar motor protein MotB